MVPSAIKRRHDKAGLGLKEQETIQEMDRENVSDICEIIISNCPKKQPFILQTDHYY